MTLYRSLGDEESPKQVWAPRLKASRILPNMQQFMEEVRRSWQTWQLSKLCELFLQLQDYRFRLTSTQIDWSHFCGDCSHLALLWCSISETLVARAVQSDQRFSIDLVASLKKICSIGGGTSVNPGRSEVPESRVDWMRSHVLLQWLQASACIRRCHPYCMPCFICMFPAGFVCWFKLARKCCCRLELGRKNCSSEGRQTHTRQLFIWCPATSLYFNCSVIYAVLVDRTGEAEGRPYLPHQIIKDGHYNRKPCAVRCFSFSSNHLLGVRVNRVKPTAAMDAKDLQYGGSCNAAMEI